jgi:hypothetical protein
MLTLGTECSSAAFALNTIQVKYSATKYSQRKECGNYAKRNTWQEMEKERHCLVPLILCSLYEVTEFCLLRRFIVADF